MEIKNRKLLFIYSPKHICQSCNSNEISFQESDFYFCFSCYEKRFNVHLDDDKIDEILSKDENCVLAFFSCENCSHKGIYGKYWDQFQRNGKGCYVYYCEKCISMKLKDHLSINTPVNYINDDDDDYISIQFGSIFLCNSKKQ